MFFPVPYAYYDPNIVYRQTKIPDVVPIHKDTGHWDQGERQMACFDNKDYKDMRMNSDDFLKEQKSQERALMQVKSFFWSDINLLYFLLVGSAHYSERTGRLLVRTGRLDWRGFSKFSLSPITAVHTIQE